jgi:hypothetical protein
VLLPFGANINRTVQINHQLDATVSPDYCLDVYVHPNMFLTSSRPSSGAQQLQYQTLVLPSERGDSSDVGRCRAGYNRLFVRSGYELPDHDQKHCYHHAHKVKPKAATAVVELMMMVVKTPETCWAVHRRQKNKLEKLLHVVGDLFELLC